MPLAPCNAGGPPQPPFKFSMVMSELASTHVRSITSEVHVVSYVDDTILTGPAEEVTKHPATTSCTFTTHGLRAPTFQDADMARTPSA